MKIVKTYFFEKNFFLESLLCIGRRHFWRLCWKVLCKSLKPSLAKSKIDLKYLSFSIFCSLRLFFWRFRPEVWQPCQIFRKKSEILLQKIWKWRIFFLRNGFRTKFSYGNVECSFEDTSHFFCLKINSSKSEIERNNFFHLKSFFFQSEFSSAILEASFGKPAEKNLPNIQKFFGDSPKKEIDEFFNKNCFSKRIL